MSFCAGAALRIRAAAAAGRRKSEEILLSSTPLAISLALRTHVLPRTTLVRAFFACVRARERSGHAWGVGISRIHEGRSNGRHAMQEGAVTFLAPPTSSLRERAERDTRYFEGAVGSEISPRAQ